MELETLFDHQKSVRWKCSGASCFLRWRSLCVATAFREPATLMGNTLLVQSVLDMPVLQEAPPPGGFPSIRIERRLPNTGPTGVAIFGIVGAIMSYGFWQVWRGHLRCLLQSFCRPRLVSSSIQAYPYFADNPLPFLGHFKRTQIAQQKKTSR